MVEARPNLRSPHQRCDGSLTRELGWIEGSTVAIASLALVLPGNGIPPPRDSWPKIASRPENVSAETETPTSKPANCGPLASLREIFRFERVRGGPGRTRTSNQTVTSRRL